MGSKQGAIVTIWKAQSLEPSDANVADLEGAYLKLDPGGCAVLNGKLNESCPLVKEHFCLAQSELASRAAESGLPEEANRVHRDAVAKGCR